MGEYGIEDLKFEWDDEKEKINLKKHGIGFEMAAEVFLDDYAIYEYDDIHSDGEERYRVIGMVENILVVIYTEREENIRIISARPAEKKEARRYYDR